MAAAPFQIAKNAVGREELQHAVRVLCLCAAAEETQMIVRVADDGDELPLHAQVLHLSNQRFDRHLVEPEICPKRDPTGPCAMPCESSARATLLQIQGRRAIESIRRIAVFLKPMRRPKLQISHDADIGCGTVFRSFHEFVLAAGKEIAFYILNDRSSSKSPINSMPQPLAMSSSFSRTCCGTWPGTKIADVVAEIEIVIAHADKIFSAAMFMLKTSFMIFASASKRTAQRVAHLAVRHFAVFKEQHQFAVALFNGPDLFENLGQQLSRTCSACSICPSSFLTEAS